jgi:hypothetical protein
MGESWCERRRDNTSRGFKRGIHPPTSALPANGEWADFPPFAGGLRGGIVSNRLTRSITPMETFTRTQEIVTKGAIA